MKTFKINNKGRTTHPTNQNTQSNMKYEKGKRITDVTQFKKGSKYTDATVYEVFEFSHVGANGSPYFKDNGKGYSVSESEYNCIGFSFGCFVFYEAVEVSTTLDDKIEEHLVPEYEIGKEYEFSNKGEYWSKRKLLGIIEHEFKYVVEKTVEARSFIDGYKQIREIKQREHLQLENI